MALTLPLSNLDVPMASPEPILTTPMPDPLRGRILVPMSSRSPAQRRHLPSSPFNARPERVIEEFAVDDRVTHDAHGLGRIVGVEGAAVTVDFGSHQLRVVSPFNKLTKI